VTALYEIVPTALVGFRPGDGGGAASLLGGVDPTRYQAERALAGPAFEGELATIKVRYKPPGGTESIAFATVARDAGTDWTTASLDLRFAAAVAMFGEALSGSPNRGEGSLARAQMILLAALRDDPNGDREALLDLVRRARDLGAQ
jgi:Ca-activated chloride channel family protein